MQLRRLHGLLCTHVKEDLSRTVPTVADMLRSFLQTVELLDSQLALAALIHTQMLQREFSRVLSDPGTLAAIDREECLEGIGVQLAAVEALFSRVTTRNLPLTLN